MKKNLLMLLFVILYVSGCSAEKPTESISHKCSELSSVEYEAQNHAVYALKNGQYCYHLLCNGEVFHCETTERYPEINTISDDVVEIRVGHGTGTSSSKYCNINEKNVSAWHDDVVFCFEDFVIRLEYDKDNVNGRKHSLVVSGMFTHEDKKTCSFDDISDEPMPIKQIKLIDDGFEVEYFTIDGDTNGIFFSLIE